METKKERKKAAPAEWVPIKDLISSVWIVGSDGVGRINMPHSVKHTEGANHG